MPAPVALARREELLSDIHDQVADGQAAGRPGRRLSYALCRRMLKGIVADVAWRAKVEADLVGRDVLLARPGAVLSGLGIMSVPFSLVAEVTRHSTGWLGAVYAPAWFLASAIWMLAISYGMVAAGEAMLRGRIRRRSFLDKPSRVLRIALPLLCFLYALSGVWRFKGGALAMVSVAAWAAFGVVLVATGIFAVALLVRRARTRG